VVLVLSYCLVTWSLQLSLFFGKGPLSAQIADHFHVRCSFSRTLLVSLLGSHLARLLRKSLFPVFFWCHGGKHNHSPRYKSLRLAMLLCLSPQTVPCREEHNLGPRNLRTSTCHTHMLHSQTVPWEETQSQPEARHTHMLHSQTVPWEETQSQPEARGLTPCHTPLSVTSDCAMLGRAQSQPVEPQLRHTPHTHAALSDCVMRGNTSTARDTRVCAHTHKLHSTPLSISSDQAMQGASQSQPEAHTPYRNSPWSELRRVHHLLVFGIQISRNSKI